MSITSTKTQELKFPVLAEHADAIRRLGKQTVENIIEIGARLTECKHICGHGNWLPWLEREFGWEETTAQRFMRVHALAQSKSGNLPDLPVSAIYLLAAPSTPEAARSEIIERAKTGTPVSVAEVKQTINAAKARRGAEATGKALPVDKRTGADGKARRRPVKGGAESPAEQLVTKKGWSRERWRRYKERKRGHRSKNSTPAAAPPTPAQARQDIGPAGTGEVERLRARVDELQAEKRQLEIKIKGFESEVEDLRAENAELRAKLEAAACTPAGAPPKNGGRRRLRSTREPSPTRCTDQVQSTSTDTPTIEERAAAIAAKGVQEPIPDFLRRKPTEVVS
jgi:hypothetical protein